MGPDGGLGGQHRDANAQTLQAGSEDKAEMTDNQVAHPRQGAVVTGQTAIPVLRRAKTRAFNLREGYTQAEVERLFPASTFVTLKLRRNKSQHPNSAPGTTKLGNEGERPMDRQSTTKDSGHSAISDVESPILHGSSTTTVEQESRSRSGVEPSPGANFNRDEHDGQVTGSGEPQTDQHSAPREICSTGPKPFTEPGHLARADTAWVNSDLTELPDLVSEDFPHQDSSRPQSELRCLDNPKTSTINPVLNVGVLKHYTTTAAAEPSPLQDNTQARISSGVKSKSDILHDTDCAENQAGSDGECWLKPTKLDSRPVSCVEKDTTLQPPLPGSNIVQVIRPGDVTDPIVQSRTGFLTLKLRQPQPSRTSESHNQMAPNRDSSSVEGALKDAVQTLYEVQSQVHGFVPETQPLLIEKMTELARALAKIQTLASPTASPDNPIHKNRIAPEIIDYVDDSRNPDIYNREFVELVQRGNAVVNGKQQAFRDFSQVFADALKEGFDNMDEQVDRVMKNAKLPEQKSDRQKPGGGSTNGAGKV